MRPVAAHTLLEVWDLGQRRHPVDRAVLLLGLATPDADPDGLADVPLGRRNASLLALRRATFGDRLRAYADCPGCAQRLEIDLAVSELLASVPEPEGGPVEVDGLRLRLPTSRDLAAVAVEGTAEAAAARLLERCVVGGAPAGGLAAREARLEAALEAADPWADLSLGLRCERCGHSWSAPLDVAALLWEELEARARRLLDEVHALARAYGWSEGEILALSEARRTAYLERAQA